LILNKIFEDSNFFEVALHILLLVNFEDKLPIYFVLYVRGQLNIKDTALSRMLFATIYDYVLVQALLGDLLTVEVLVT
jgi:hypothetical protein